MAERKITEVTLSDGAKTQAEDMDYEIENESWNRYRLSDGSLVKIKHVVSNIYRLIDDEGNYKKTDAGDPQVLISSATMVTASEG